MAHKAMKGGEIGANGEFYKGGQFVADDPKTVKGENKWLIESSETFSIWYKYHTDWVEDSEWDNESHKYVTKGIYLSGRRLECIYDMSKPNWYDHIIGHQMVETSQAERRFFGYMISLYLEDKFARMSKQDEINLRFALYPEKRDTNFWVPSGKTLAECATITEADVPALIEKIDAKIAEHGIRVWEDVLEEREAARKAAIVSKHIGTVGEKMERDVEMTAAIPFESDFGGGTVYKFKDTDGNELVWMTSSALKTGKDEDGFDTYAAVGDKLRIKFTVKAHDSYCDVPQTKIFRVKAVA